MELNLGLLRSLATRFLRWVIGFTIPDKLLAIANELIDAYVSSWPSCEVLPRQL